MQYPQSLPPNPQGGQFLGGAGSGGQVQQNLAFQRGLQQQQQQQQQVLPQGYSPQPVVQQNPHAHQHQQTNPAQGYQQPRPH